MAVKMEIRTITPEDAVKWLEKNPGNRGVRPRKVDMFAGDMKSGNWKLNGSALTFNGTGKLLDGQHRLLACIKANKPFESLVITGISDDAHRTIDTGTARTMADELKFQGETHVHILAAMLLLLNHYDNGTVTQPQITPSRSTLLAYLRKNPEVRESAPIASLATKAALRGTTFAATHYLIRREHGLEVADKFVSRVLEGVDYTPGDPCLALRNWAVNVASSRNLRPTAVEWFAAVIKTANAWLLGREVKSVSWRSTGPKREQFPSLLSKDDVGGVAPEDL